MRKRMLLFLLAMLLPLGGCRSIYSESAVASTTASEEQAALAAPSPEPKELYYMVGMHIVLPYWQEHRRGLETAAEELGVRAVFTGVSGNNALRQVDVFNQAVQEEPAGILVSPIDPEAMRGPINAAMAKGIPVICIDSDAPSSDRLMYIGTDNYQSGWIAAQIIGDELEGRGDVGILTVPGLFSMDQRQKGFEDCLLENYPDMRVVAVGNDEADPSKAVNVAGEMFRNCPEIRGLFGVNAASGVGAAIALEEGDMLNKVVVVAYDRDSAVLDLVEQGAIKATLVQRTFTMSYYGLKLLYDYNHRRFGITDDPMIVNPLPTGINTGVIVVTKENVQDFR